MVFDPAALNFLAVLAAAAATFFLGSLWYTIFFGYLWRKLHGYSDERMREMQAKRPMPVFFGILIVCYLIAALVMAAILVVFRIETAFEGAMLGFVLWIVVAAVEMTGHAASDRHIGIYLIDVSYQLIYLVMMGAILGAWR